MDLKMGGLTTSHLQSHRCLEPTHEPNISDHLTTRRSKECVAEWLFIPLIEKNAKKKPPKATEKKKDQDSRMSSIQENASIMEFEG